MLLKISIQEKNPPVFYAPNGSILHPFLLELEQEVQPYEFQFGPFLHASFAKAEEVNLPLFQKAYPIDE